MYEIKKTTSLTRPIQSADADWPFPQIYFKNVGLTVRGFNFFYPNLSTSLKNFFQPSQNLLNIEPGTEEISAVPTQYLFYPVQQQIEENIKKYDVPAKYFINESYFWYDKSDLIKESYITAINKKVFLYGPISHFNKKKKKKKTKY